MKCCTFGIRFCVYFCVLYSRLFPSILAANSRARSVNPFSNNRSINRGVDVRSPSIEFLLFPILKAINNITSETQLSKGCRAVYEKAVPGPRGYESWVIQMSDASGRFPTGILDGTSVDFGSFDQCLKIRMSAARFDDEIRSKYCMVKYQFILSSVARASFGTSVEEIESGGQKWLIDALRNQVGISEDAGNWIGICVPSVCSKEDVREISAYFHPLKQHSIEAHCQTDERRPLKLHNLLSICVFGVIAVLVSIGTLKEFFGFNAIRKAETDIQSQNYSWAQFLGFFSIISNTRYLFQNSNNVRNLQFFDGMRTVFSIHIILLHMIFLPYHWNSIKYKHFQGLKDVGQTVYAIYENYHLPVEAFFFISGFLMVYNNWTKFENKRSGYLVFLVQKIIRLMPVFLFLLLVLFLPETFFSGPLRGITSEPWTEVCRNNWWKSLSFISNFSNLNDVCLLHTWFLSALMQAHVVGVLLLIVTLRYPFPGFAIGLLATLASLLTLGWRVAVGGFLMITHFNYRKLDHIVEYMSDAYIAPYVNVSSYLMGMLAGYAVLKYRHVELSKRQRVLGWIVSLLCTFGSFNSALWQRKSLAAAVWYFTLHRVLWGTALSWITFICAKGRASVVGSVLSWRGFRPFGELSYLIYMIHPVIIMLRHAWLKERVYLETTDGIFQFLSCSLLSLLLAYVVFVSFDFPIRRSALLLVSKLQHRLHED